MSVLSGCDRLFSFLRDCFVVDPVHRELQLKNVANKNVIHSNQMSLSREHKEITVCKYY